MSEKSKRGATPATNTAASKRTKSDGRKFSAAFLKIAKDFDDLRKDTEGLQEYDDLVSSHASLKQAIEEKGREIEALNKDTQERLSEKDDKIEDLQARLEKLEKEEEILNRKHESRINQLKAEALQHSIDASTLDQLERKLQDAQASAVAADNQIRQLEGYHSECEELLKDHQATISSLEAKCDRKRAELEETQKKLNTCRDTLTTLRGDVGILSLSEEKK
jgi:chromosome segregation ATPase